MNRTKRKQVSIACSNCRQSKTACDEGRPCIRCKTKGIADTCKDAPKKKRTRKFIKNPTPKKKHRPNSMIPETILSPVIINNQISNTNSLFSSIPNQNNSLLELDNDNNININTLSSQYPSRIPSIENLSSIISDNVSNDISYDNNQNNNSVLIKEDIDNSSTPFLSLKYHQNPLLFTSPKLSPISSPNQCELPFRTVAEPTVDLFADSNNNKPQFKLGTNFSDESLEISGIRKTPSLETLISTVLRENEISNDRNEDISIIHPLVNNSSYSNDFNSNLKELNLDKST